MKGICCVTTVGEICEVIISVEWICSELADGWEAVEFSTASVCLCEKASTIVWYPPTALQEMNRREEHEVL